MAAARACYLSRSLYSSLSPVITLARVACAFTLAMAFGTAIGLVMGRVGAIDRLGDPWLIVLLNLPALVVIVLAFIWGGLTEIAGILAVAVNKLPNTVVTVREGSRALDRDLDEMARAFAIPRWKALRHVVLPQLAPYIAAAARSGLALIWKIVLVFEVLGSDGGVGFRINTMFQFFDMKGILAYTTAFILVVLVFEYWVMRPLEHYVLRWRTDRA